MALFEPEAEELLKHPSRPGTLMVLSLMAAAAPAYPVQENQLAQSSKLKGLSIEQLMEIDVTSVSRRSEPVSRAAAAITVLTGEDIRRSGATNLPDALRIAASLQVAPVRRQHLGDQLRGASTPPPPTSCWC